MQNNDIKEWNSMLFYQLMFSLNKKIRVFEFAYKTYGINWDYEPVIHTHYLYVIAKTKKEAKAKAQEVARIQANKSWWPNEKYEPVFHQRVSIKHAMEHIMNLHVAESVVNSWPCNMIARKAAQMRGALY
jgi:hypothetical protein